MTIPFNPYTQTTAAGSFAITADGLICGTELPDPATRFSLAGGTLAATETLPMWGGVGLSENIPHETGAFPGTQLGGIVARATALANLTGFAVYDQNYAAINSPSSPVPQTGVGGLINFHRLGSGQRVALEIDPTLITLEGGLITQAVTWDFTNQKIIAGAGPLPVKIILIVSANCMSAVYNSTTGALTWNKNAAGAVCVL